MPNEEKLDLVYGLESLYDLMEDGEDDLQSERPVCDELKQVDVQYDGDEQIAEGGMKRIFKVFDNKLKRYVALARLQKNMPRAAHDSFIREARLTALLEHPGIISVYNIGIDDEDMPFFTMELKVGKNLSEIVSNTHLDSSGTSLNHLLESFLRVCDAISYAHAKNVLHLDIKPDNVQMGQFGEVKVCDWGLGKVIGEEDSAEFDQLLFNPDLLNNMTLSGEIKGTPGYMAPEQIRGEEKTKQTDIFSLGCVLYYILCGKPAFAGGVQDILSRTLVGDFLEPSLRSDLWLVPESLNAVALKAMSTSAEARYQSVEELKNEVHNYLAGRSTHAEKAGPLKELKLFWKRNKTLCALTSLFLCILIIGTLMFTLQLQKKNTELKEESERVEQSRQIAEREKKIAEREKKIAQTALKQTENERSLVKALVDKRSVDVVKIYNLTDRMVFHNPEVYLSHAQELLEKIEPLDSEYAWATMQLAYVHFLKQEFREAKALFEISNNDPELHALALRYTQASQAGEILELAALQDLLKDVLDNKYRMADALKILLYDSVKRKDADERAVLAKFMLEKINPAWTQPLMIYNEKEKSLKLSGKGLVRLAVESKQLHQTGPSPDRRIFVTYGLSFHTLDLSKSSFKNLDLLEGLKLKELNICQSEVQDLSALKNFDKLEVLRVSKGAFSQEQLSVVPDSIKVFEQ
ncbi:protein kinase [Lentisphaera marina]|uniref:serine/threonine-protein kinase n=1 Tax=Lentisphaera marina TaxID=1111041 RepID=UPI0023662E02|nr:serine/threonine protein kinase [Lentisphaera marina]MDD7986020.1 protein kinase [Lentisphaera marina]